MPGYGLGYSSLLRRSSGPSGPSYGTLTTAWITATGETDATILGALNTLESDLTTYGLTSKIKALYPFVGGTAAKHKYNFMDARDLDAAFRLVFNGGWTHSSTGVLPNGTNAYADTKYNLSVNSTTTNISAGVYSRTNVTRDSAVLSALDANFIGSELLLKWSDNNTYYCANDRIADGGANFISNTQGFFIINRFNSTTKKIYKNGSSVSSFTIINSSAPNLNVFLSSRNYIGSASGYDTRELAFSYLGDTLTDTEASNFYTAVQTFQTTLSRNV
jgi:hypothetical protein